LYARTTTDDDFNNLWAMQCGDIDYQTVLAVRFYSVHDNSADVAELVRVWSRKNGVSFTESMIKEIMVAADEATSERREAFRRIQGKITRHRNEKRRGKLMKSPKTITLVLYELPGTAAGIAIKLDLDRKTVGAALRRLYVKGEADQHPGGHYTVAGVPDQRPQRRTPAKGHRATLAEPQQARSADMDGVYNRFKKAMPGTDRVTFNEYLEKAHIGLEGIMDTISAYERQVGDA
jgi:hypothetical protein